MQPIQRNKPVFFGNDGKLLVNASIYIGLPEKDPEVVGNRKTVMFQDNVGNEFEAGQPLRTNENGQIAFNGSATIALVDGDYSMLIKDSNGSQIDDGYTARVTQIDTGSASEIDAIKFGLTLTEVKALNVQQGDVVENIGGAIVTDGLSKRWLVQLPNGQPEDDENYINFTNGQQGARLDTPADAERKEQINNQIIESFTVTSAGAIANKQSNAVVSSIRNGLGWYQVTVNTAGLNYNLTKFVAWPNQSSATPTLAACFDFDDTTPTFVTFNIRCTQEVTGNLQDTDVSVMAIGETV